MDTMKERFLLAVERIAEIEKEDTVEEPYRAYFNKTAAFLSLMAETYDFVESGRIGRASLEDLQRRNAQLYEDIQPVNYEKSYANPVFARHIFGEAYGRIFCFLSAELRSLIAYAHEGQTGNMVIRMELFLEIYSAFLSEPEGHIPDTEALQQILYWFVSDYTERAEEERISCLTDPNQDFACKLVMNFNLSDIRYLYYYGEYVSENEVAVASYLAGCDEETIRLMADTYTEGYRKGYEITGKDMTKKKTVNIRYRLGFERMIKQAVLNFDHLGLRPIIYRASVSVLRGKSMNRTGYFGAVPNKQYDYDHKDDQALILDKQLLTRRLEALEAAYEKNKSAAAVLGGPAVVEVFGETPFSPMYREEALHLSDKQTEWVLEYTTKAGELQDRYIPGKERSFTIIAFPTPEIGSRFQDIFHETIRLNTLDYNLYRDIQQTVIDALDKGEYVCIRGMGDNRTDLKVRLIDMQNPLKETKFENCVADVNIPVGEVFTTPVLKGTEGVLHVPRVFLHDLEYRNIMLIIKDGMITEYRCTNFDDEIQNRIYLEDNLLYHHATLPVSEFAIGTNTTAYMTGIKYDISHLFPILIAEKTGPHFAFGDTCYSHAEDVSVFNPDGKEIVARDNDISLLRKTDLSKAYYNCHTDITIPYDELGELSVITQVGERIPIIEKGRFVLDGCSELNKAFDGEQ